MNGALKRKRSNMEESAHYYPHKPIPGGNTIVLHLSAHGIEYPKVSTPLITCRNTHISTLSFPGYIGTLGIMLKPDDATPAFDSASLAVIVNKYKSETPEAEVDHVALMDQNVKDLRGLLTSNYPRGMDYLSSSSFKNFTGLPPFQILTHVEYEREYVFEPSPHEDCNKCIKKDNSISECTEQEVIRRKCPFYGLNIVYAYHNKYEDDWFNSFASVKSRMEVNRIDENKRSIEEYITGHEYGNLNKNYIIERYWAKRIDETKTTVKTKAIVEGIFKTLIDNNNITLSEICILFKFLGYQNIFIYDPTCRSCDIADRMTKDPSYIDTAELIRIKNNPLLSIYDNELITEKVRNIKRSRYLGRISHKQILHNTNTTYERTRRLKKASKMLKASTYKKRRSKRLRIGSARTATNKKK